MITDAAPLALLESSSDTKSRARAAFVSFLEKKLGLTLLYDQRRLPFGHKEFQEEMALARRLEHAGVLQRLQQLPIAPDEPQTKRWSTTDTTGNEAGGAALFEERPALMAALAECLERYLWRTATDYFSKPIQATEETIARYTPYIAPKRFASFSDEQRKASSKLTLRNDAQYLWIRGYSHVAGKHTYLPAQTVAGARTWLHASEEPRIRSAITIGLATWPTQAGAHLAGANEIIEREAYMIMWLNHLTLPRIDLDALSARDQELARALKMCSRYRIRVHAIEMLTDAPTHAIAVVIEDESSVAPKFVIGLKAHRSLTYAVKKALTEALRGRGFSRKMHAEGSVWDMSRPVESVGHYERLHYWSVPEYAEKLRFLIDGPVHSPQEKPCDSDTEGQQLNRIVSWCKDKGFEMVSVPLTPSKSNPTRLHIEMVVIPELQHTYLTEGTRQLSDRRRVEVPRLFGYAPRETPFLDDPHPFA